MHFGILDNCGLYEPPADACFSSYFVESAKIWVNDNIAGYGKKIKEWIWQMWERFIFFFDREQIILRRNSSLDNFFS